MKKKKSLKEQCHRYENCEATLCPLDPKRCAHIWYPDEEICKLRKYQTKRWIQKQKRIAKVATVEAGFFSIPMLEAVSRVTKTVTGADPDVWKSDIAWLERVEKDKKRKPTINKTSDNKVVNIKKSRNTRTRKRVNKNSGVCRHENRKGKKRALPKNKNS